MLQHPDQRLVPLFYSYVTYGPRRDFVWIGGPSLTFFSGSGGVEVSKKVKKIPETIDLVARGLRTRLPAPAGGAADDCWPPVPRVTYRMLLRFAPRFCASQNVRIQGSSHSAPVPWPDYDLRGGQQCPLPIVPR